MNRPEILKLFYMVQSLCPSQAATEHTADAWLMVLDDINYADARDAVVNIAKKADLDLGRTLYIDPSAIRGEVRRIRGRRVESFDLAKLTPPSGLNPAEYQSWLVSTRHRIADGETFEQIEGAPVMRGALTDDERKALNLPARAA